MNTEDSYNIQALLSKFVVRIPKIQREYAQGRKEGKAPAIRKKFVRDLLDQVCGKNDLLQLDLVYGVNAKSSDSLTSFLPIDGQQRLTTLYLLAWFCGTDMTVWKFDYKSRRAAQFFMDGLKVHPRKGGKPSDELEGASWFHDSWHSDPSVDGMIVVLDEMYENNKDPIDILRTKTGLGKICFYVEEGICGHGMTEDDAEKAYGHLFLKMNARGLPLTDWEVVKNEIDKYAEQKSSWREFINADWQENLWPFAKRYGNDIKARVVRLDVAMLTIVTMCARFCKKSRPEDFDSWLGKQDENVKDTFFQWCEDAFTYCVSIEDVWTRDRQKNALWKSLKDDDKNPTQKGDESNRVDDKDNFPKRLTEGGLSASEQLRFAILVRGKTLSDDKSTRKRLRQLLNLLDNTDVSEDKFDSLFSQSMSYLKNGRMDELTGFHEKQLADEQWKNQFDENEIIKIERNSLVWLGSTAFLGETCPEEMLVALSKLQESIITDRKSLFLSLLGLSEKCDTDLPCGSIWIPEVEKVWAEECFSAKRLFLRKGVTAWLKNERYNTDSGSSAWLNYLSDLWDTVENCGLKRIATKNAGWLFCIGNSYLTNDAIRMIRSQVERKRLELLDGVESTDDGIPYITWGILPYNGFMKARDKKWYFNVKRESWWNLSEPEYYSYNPDEDSFKPVVVDDVHDNS